MINQQTIQNEEKVSIDYALTINGEQKSPHTNNTIVVAIAKSEDGIGVNVVGEFNPNMHLNMLKALMTNYYKLFLKHSNIPMDEASQMFDKVLASAYNTALIEQVSNRMGLEEDALRNTLLEITEGAVDLSKEHEVIQRAVQSVMEGDINEFESNESIQESHAETASSVESSGVSETGTEEAGSEAEGTGDTTKSNG